jgi:hypothetical protein
MRPVDVVALLNSTPLDIDVATPERRRGYPASDTELGLCADLAVRMSKAEGFAGTAALRRVGALVLSAEINM